MTDVFSSEKPLFKLPVKGSLEPNDADDPLRQYYRPLIGCLYRSRIEQALGLLEPPYESILEVGYGSGVMMPALASIGEAVSGVDMKSDPETVASNLSKIGVQASLRRADILTTDYPDGNFDLVVAISVFEHISFLEPVIKKVFSLLRPGGHFLVGMPRVDTLMKIAFPLIGYHNIEAHHISNYRQFLKASAGLFRLARFIRIPSWTPSFMGLYFNMLLCKQASGHK